MSALLPILEKIKRSREQAKALVTYPAKARSFRRRQYQQEDITWLRQRKRAILGWAPGLGKTFAGLEAAEFPAVVSVPTTLVNQWIDFINEEYPHLTVANATKGDAVKRDVAINGKWDVLIVNHEMWRTYYLPAVETLIVDEFHHFRHSKAAKSKGLYRYAQRVPRVYGLTATPVFKDVGDLWHQLHILDRDKWSSFDSFINYYAVTYGDAYGTKVLSARNTDRLKEKTADYLKERTYKEVGMFLPDRIDKSVLLELDPKFKKNVYEPLRDFYRLQIIGEDGTPMIERYANAGAVLHKLRQILVTDEKLAAVKEIIEDTPNDDPVIVFTWYKDTAAKAASYFDGVEITGDDSPTKRRELALTGGPDKKRVRVANMAALSEGVDLSAARTVIFLEEDYVPGKNYQAMTRVQRHSTTGDQRPIVAYWVRYKDTVDEVVHKTARSRTSGNALSVLKEALGIL